MAGKVIEGKSVKESKVAAADEPEAIAKLPWRCAPCWVNGEDVQLKDKEQSDPTGRVECDKGHSHWGKSGLGKLGG